MTGSKQTKDKANFKVDPKLASLLGENYRSTELAIKELIDNAYDADSENVWISLPEPLTSDPIIVEDDGAGMTEKEVRTEYLKIASSRASRKGERTHKKQRLVKGRKGIGKFAGLMVADVMSIETRSRKLETLLSIPKMELAKANYDLEKVDLPIEIRDCDDDVHGTTIILNSINQNLIFPNPERLKQLIIVEYGRVPDFRVFVNGELVDIEDIPGETIGEEITLPEVGKINIRYTISEQQKNLKQWGISIRVGGKIVGRPKTFGLDKIDHIPNRLLRRVYGEVIADGLIDDVTADWGAIIENSRGMSEIKTYMQSHLESALKNVYSRETELTKARLHREIRLGLTRVPEYRRELAEKALDRVINKFYGESEAKIASIFSVVLDSFEKSDYWAAMQNVEKARLGSISDFSDALFEFGRLDIAIIAQQSHTRLSILDELEALIQNDETSTPQILKVLEKNIWILGHEYALSTSNESLQNVINMYLDRTYTGYKAKNRPTLLMVQNYNRKFLLLDFKKPNHSLNRHDERQGKEYRNELKVYLPGHKIETIVMGKDVKPSIKPFSARFEISFLAYQQIIDNARNQLNWMIEEFRK